MKTKKSVVCLLLSLLLALAVLPQLAASAAADGMYEYEVVDGKAVITRYLGSGVPTVTLPESLGGYPVTGVGKEAFGAVTNGEKPHAEVKTVVPHAGITSIGDRAFAGTAWIDSPAAADADGFVLVNNILIHYSGKGGALVVPDGTKTVNIAAFEKNETIKSVELPESVTKIDDYAFYRCTALTDVYLGDAVTSIGRSAFYGCSSLAMLESASGEMTLPAALRTVGENAFYNCSALRGVLICGDKTEEIGTYAFAGCRSLSGIRVPDTLSRIGDYAFGFLLTVRNGIYYPEQMNGFTIYVTHLADEDIDAERERLKDYNKTAKAIYRYANNPDGSGYFPPFPLEWDRLAYDFLLGDVNNDGKRTSVDARAILRHASKLTPLTHEDDLRAGDINKDGRVNSSDARLVLRAVARLETF